MLLVLEPQGLGLQALGVRQELEMGFRGRQKGAVELERDLGPAARAGAAPSAQRGAGGLSAWHSPFARAVSPHPRRTPVVPTLLWPGFGEAEPEPAPRFGLWKRRGGASTGEARGAGPHCARCRAVPCSAVAAPAGGGWAQSGARAGTAGLLPPPASPTRPGHLPSRARTPPRGWDLGCSARKTLLRRKQREGDQVVTLL